MSGKKVLFLCLALLLPVGTFLFLKFFGKNKFEVPFLHEQPITAAAGCDYAYPSPYLLADSIMRSIQNGKESNLYLLNFSNDPTVVNTITDDFAETEVMLVDGPSISGLPDFEKCVLLKPENADLVLIDSKKRIRGYYEAADLDELDRMVVEVRILIDRY